MYQSTLVLEQLANGKETGHKFRFTNPMLSQLNGIS